MTFFSLKNSAAVLCIIGRRKDQPPNEAPRGKKGKGHDRERKKKEQRDEKNRSKQVELQLH